MLHFFKVRHFVPELSVAVLQAQPADAAMVDLAPPWEHECGWFNSSFDLRFGLVVQELPCLALLPAPLH